MFWWKTFKSNTLWILFLNIVVCFYTSDFAFVPQVTYIYWIHKWHIKGCFQLTWKKNHKKKCRLFYLLYFPFISTVICTSSTPYLIKCIWLSCNLFSKFKCDDSNWWRIFCFLSPNYLRCWKFNNFQNYDIWWCV